MKEFCNIVKQVIRICLQINYIVAAPVKRRIVKSGEQIGNEQVLRIVLHRRKPEAPDRPKAQAGEPQHRKMEDLRAIAPGGISKGHLFQLLATLSNHSPFTSRSCLGHQK